jgi:Spy/CpxP family protein refolding chaperone
MKKVFLALLLLVGVATIAQENRKPGSKRAEMEKMTSEERSELRLKRLTEILKLNEKQQKEVGVILVEQQQKREKALAEFKSMKEKGTKPTTEERASRAKQRQEDQKATTDKLHKILTPQQMKKWDEIKERNKERMREKKATLRKEE